MKGLSIEQKAKAYDEAKYIMKEYLESSNAGVIAENTIRKAFPELAESEDERIRKALMQNLKERFGTKGNMGEGLDMPDVLAWLEKQEQKPADSYCQENCKGFQETGKCFADGECKAKREAEQEEDEEILDGIITDVEVLKEQDKTKSGKEAYQKEIDWLKSIRPQWKPSEEMLEALYKVIPKNVIAISEDEMLLDKLYQGLKYGRVLSKN